MADTQQADENPEGPETGQGEAGQAEEARAESAQTESAQAEVAQDETPSAGRDRARGRRAARAARRTARLTREIGAFAEAHGGTEGQVAYLGSKGARIVLVGEDGRWGDLVAPSHEMAVNAVERSGITLHESFDGELAAKVRTGPYEWSRMAGLQLGGRAHKS